MRYITLCVRCRSAREETPTCLESGAQCAWYASGAESRPVATSSSCPISFFVCASRKYTPNSPALFSPVTIENFLSGEVPPSITRKFSRFVVVHGRRASMCDEYKAEGDRCSHSRSNLSHGMGTIKTAANGGGDCEERQEILIAWTYDASFINIVQAGKFPGALGQFKNEANGCVFPVVRGFLKRAVDLIPPCGFFSRFAGCKTLRGIGLAFKNFVITAREVLLFLYGFYPIGHRQWEFRHLRDHRFIASDDCGFKFFPECRKVRLGPDRFWVRSENRKSATDRARDDCNKDTNYTNCHEPHKTRVSCWIISVIREWSCGVSDIEGKAPTGSGERAR